MPPSPSSRRLRPPARETYHKRGNSFGSMQPAKPKDDELALFSDMQKVERENFLLEPSEDFDDSIAKLSYFPEVSLGVNIPARGESTNLLNADGDKNDYEWLLTPPETPLFQLLDDEENQSVTQVSRGRAQSKPIQISRSSMVGNTQRASRSSASPSRLSPSPRSMARTRSSSSASRSSPPLAFQPPTPSRRSLTPPVVKTPPRRSPSPASTRTSTGSNVSTLNGTRGASPVKPNRRSSSPVQHGWQSNVPGFSFDAPSNLRTSLPDRPISRSRGGSPSSFSGLDKGSRGRRQSMSPTPSRRASSSHSIERDRMSSYSKASATSSGEDDLDSMQSVPTSYSSSPAVKRSLAVMKSRTIASSKNLSKTFTPSSVPKRSFDSAVWLMDHRKAPQDRFRPLLSGVPASTFGTANENDVHKPMFSHSCSLTTSRNARSDHVATSGSYAHNSQEQHELVGDWEADGSSRGHEDIFMFDKLDELNEEDIHYKSTKSTVNSSIIGKHVVSGRQGMEGSGRSDQALCHSINSPQVGSDKIATCSRCGVFFDAMDVDEEDDYCDLCASKIGNIFTDPVVQTIREADKQDDETANLEPYIASDPHTATDCISYRKEVSLDHQLGNHEPHADCLDQAPIHSMVDTPQEMLLEQEGKIDAEHAKRHFGDSVGNSNNISLHRSIATDCQQTEPTSVEHDLFRDQMDSHNHGLSQCNETVSKTLTRDNSHQLGSATYPNPKLENIEVTGISALLLHKSNSNKWPIVEGRALAATNVLCLESYYTRDGVNIMKRSFGWDSSSVASSSDLGSSRQSVICFERLRSGKRGDFEKSQIGSTMSRQSIASVSDMSVCSSSASLCPQSDAVGDTCFPIDTLESSTPRTAVSAEENDGFCKDTLPSAMECSCSANDGSLADLNTLNYISEVGEAAVENHSAGRMADNDHSGTNMCLSDTEMPIDTHESSGLEESCMLDTKDDTFAISQCNSGGAPEHQVDENSLDNVQMKSEIVQVSNDENKLDDCCMSSISEEDVLVSGPEANIKKPPNEEESCVVVEGSRKEIQRCFTLEEAADTILFCSSIVHDLAYKAATIALENEKKSEFVDSIRPTVTIVGRSLPKEEILPKLPHRRTPNRKVKRKRLEGETTSMETTEKDAVAEGSSPIRSASGITRNSDNMKPPKLESKCNCIIM